MQVIAYYRVSTKSQGESGLGLEAQRDYVQTAAAQQCWDVVAEYVESGVSGSIHPLERPECSKAFAHGLPVVVAKLDRLSRDVEHIAGMMKRTDFRVATMPKADTLQLHLFAMLAEQERNFISQRTKDALASLQTRADAGNADAIASVNNRTVALAKGRTEANRKKGNAVVAANAQALAESVSDAVVACMHRQGARTLQAVADCLNQRGIATARGSKWAPTSVKRVMDRLSLAFPA